MKTMVVATLALLAVTSCGGGGGGGSGGSAVGGSVSTGDGDVGLAYSNGHPITVRTTEPTILANEAEVIRLVNDRRVAIGKNALVDDSAIREVARGHSYHMIVHSFFAHTNPEGDSPGGRLSRAGIGWSMAGENIAAGYPSAQSAYDAWMNSPGHKANIERDGWLRTGVGYQYDGNSTYRWYWTQNFTKP